MATRLQRALLELSEAMGNRPWVLVFDPCDPASEDWGYATEHSAHPAYVKLGLLRAAQAMAEDRFVKGGVVRPPISKRGEPTALKPRLDHSWWDSPLGKMCSACGESAETSSLFCHPRPPPTEPA